MIAKLVDAGIDYIRLTSREHSRQESMFEYFRSIAVLDEKAGYRVEQGGVFGFFGKKTRHAIWGVKKEWALVQSSGRFAKNALRLALPGIQASRIDVQATMRIEGEQVEQAIREAYELACSAPNCGHRPREVRLIESRREAQTVYIGSRASDVFVRIYDKFAESKKEEYRGCVRFEVEIKGRAAKALWKHMSEGSDGIGYLLKLLVDVMKERGIDIGIRDFDSVPSMSFKKEPTLVENTLAWFYRSVAPAVARISGEMGWISPFSCLFAHALDEFDKRAIMTSLALCWAS